MRRAAATCGDEHTAGRMRPGSGGGDQGAKPPEALGFWGNRRTKIAYLIYLAKNKIEKILPSK